MYTLKSHANQPALVNIQYSDCTSVNKYTWKLGRSIKYAFLSRG